MHLIGRSEHKHLIGASGFMLIPSDGLHGLHIWHHLR